jgi:hypothetical protein
MAFETSRNNSGIQVLKILCLLACVTSLVGAIFPVHLSHVQPVVPQDHLHRAISLVNGLLLGALSYGIHRRLVIAWKLGWVLLILLFSESLADILRSILQQTPELGGWIASCVVAVLIAGVAAYWGRWWMRQRDFFSQARG